ncbi:MAG: CoA transferase [Pseudomonadota bacterium]
MTEAGAQPDTTRPLAGVRVLDLTNVLAGPFCCHQLVHLGAEVLKVEAAGRGDLARNLGADAGLNRANMGVSFLAQNAGKRSVTLNLKDPRGVGLLKRLVRAYDVLVENFRPGVMARLGVDYPALKAENPRLIYAAISGFGQDGPWIARPAYDQIIQGASGVMQMTGEPDRPPLRVGYPVADTVAGLTAAMAISAALNARPRGAMIDVSMLESMIVTMGWAVSNHLMAGVSPSRMGNENNAAAPSGGFRVADGMINIAANKDEQWRALVAHLGCEHLLDDPRYATRDDRKRHRHPLRAALEAVLVTRPGRDWVDELNGIGIPAGPVMSVPEIMAEPQIADRGLLATFPDVPGVGRDVTVVRTGVKIDGVAPRVEAPPPELGQHNDEVWGEMGLAPEEIADLKAEGVL